MSSNLALAKALADFADALADYNHLPPLGFVAVPASGVVRAQPAMTLSTDERVAAVATWAATFRSPVLMDLTDMSDGDVRVSTLVAVQERETLLYVVLLPSQYRSFEPGLGIGEVAAGEQVQVTAEQLLGAVSKAVA